MKDFLFKHDLPVKVCAADLGISASYLYQILKKERKPSLALAIKIENYTNGEVSAAELIGAENASLEHEVLDHHKKVDELIEEKLEPIRQSLQSIDKRLEKIENS